MVFLGNVVLTGDIPVSISDGLGISFDRLFFHIVMLYTVEDESCA